MLLSVRDGPVQMRAAQPFLSPILEALLHHPVHSRIHAAQAAFQLANSKSLGALRCGRSLLSAASLARLLPSLRLLGFGRGPSITCVEGPGQH
jgi:hypothetical protein